MGVKAEDMKACMKAQFEALTAEIVKQFDRDVGPYRLIDNPTFRYIWKNYLVGSDHISGGTFVDGMKSYWKSKRDATADDTEDTLFTDANVTALMNVMDSDGNGKVYVREVNNALKQASLALESDASTFEGMFHRLVEAGKQQVVKKLLGVHLKQFEDRKHELEAYIHPLVVKEVPGNMSLTEYVGKLDSVTGGGSSSVDTAPISTLPVPEPLVPRDGSSVGVFEEFLSGDSPLFLLLGEPGSGKSLFSWHRCKLNERKYVSVKEGLAVLSEGDPWIPIAIDLKNYGLSGIKGLLTRYLEKECKLTKQELSMLRSLVKSKSITSSNVLSHQKLKLLVFCDGFDELHAEDTAVFNQSGFSDFTANLLAGLDVEAKVVVTCRDRHLKGGREEENRVFLHGGKAHVRRVLLPFRSSQIDEYIGKWISTSTLSTGSEVAIVRADVASEEQAAKTVTGNNLEAKFVKQASAATPVHSQTDRNLSLLQYQLTIQSSESLQQIVRNPFVLCLFVDALPQLSDANGRVDVSTVTRYAIYGVFVRRYISRQLKEKCRLDGGKWMLPNATRAPAVQDVNAVDDALIDDVERLCCLIAGKMFARNSLTVDLDKDGLDSVWASLRDDFFEFDGVHVRSRARASWNAMRPVDQFPFKCDGVNETAFVERAVLSAQHCRWVTLKHAKQLCPLRKIGDVYSFLHKSFYEYFLAKLVLSVGSDSLYSEEQRVQRMTSVLGSGRGWQSEPEAIYFLCDKWWATGAHEPASDVQSTRRCLFGVVKASSAGSSPAVVGANDLSSSSVQQHAAVSSSSASANAATILSWLNEPFSGVQWDGVQLAGADLSFAVFVGASLRGANLSNCMLKKTVLSGADLTGANLYGVNFAERAPVLVEGDDCLAVVQVEGSPYEFRLVDGIVQVYTSTGVPRVCLHGNGRVRTVAVIPGYAASVCESGDGIVWETQTFSRVWCKSQVGTIALSKHLDKSMLIVGDIDGVVALWDVQLRQALSSVQLLPSAACAVMYVDDRDDSSSVAVGCASGAISLLHMNDERDLLALISSIPGDGSAIVAIALSPSHDSKLIAACIRDSNSVKVWSCNTGDCLCTLSGHEKPVTCVAFSPAVQGRPLLLATGSDDCDCRLWDVASGQQYGPALQGHVSPVLSVRFEPGEHGMLVSVGADKRIRFWDIDSANAYRELLQVSERVTAMNHNATGTGFTSVGGSGEVVTWEISRSADDLPTVLMPRWLQRADAVQAASVMCMGHVDTSGNPVLAIGGSNGAFSLWRNGSTLPVGNCGKPIVQVCFAGEDTIATGTRDGSVQLWSMVNGTTAWSERTLQFADGEKVLALVSSRGPSPLLARANYTDVRCWDLTSDSDVPLYTRERAKLMLFGPPGHSQYLAVSTSDRVKVCDARYGHVIRVLSVKTKAATALCWLSPSLLASGYADVTIRVWDVVTGRCLHSIPSVSIVQQLLTAPNANAVVALCDDGVLRVWDDSSWGMLTQSRSHVAGPFALDTFGITLSSIADTQLLQTCGFNAGFCALVSAVLFSEGVAPSTREQQSHALSHRLSVPSSDSFLRTFQRHVQSCGIGVLEGLQAVLLNLVARSATDGSLSVAAGNAASCLNRLSYTLQTSALVGLDWSGVRLTGADLRGVDMSGTRLQGATLIDCDFSGAILTGVDFTGVDLSASKFVVSDRVLPGSLFAWSPTRADGSSLLASVVDDTVIQVWQPGSGECTAVLKGHTKGLACLLFGTRSDGTLLLASGGYDRTVRVWGIEAGGDAAVVLPGHAETVRCVGFGTRSDGKLLLASGSDDKEVRLWDVDSGGECLATLSGHNGTVTCISVGTWSNGRMLLASGSRDKRIWLWDVEVSPVAGRVLEGHTHDVSCLSFGTTGSGGRLFLVSGSRDNTIRLWDVEAGREAAVLSGHTDIVNCFTLGTRSDGKLCLASGSDDKTVRLWDVEAGDGSSASGIVLSGHPSSVHCLCFSTLPDGKLLLASGSSDNTVRVWDVEAGGDAVVLSGHVGGVTRLSIGGVPRTGKQLLACGSYDGTVRLWSIDPLQSVLSGRRMGITAAAIPFTSVESTAVANDKLASWAFDPAHPCFRSGEYVSTISLRSFGDVVGLAISPDGSCFVVSDTGLHKIGVYSLPGGVPQAEFGSEGSGPAQFQNPLRVCFVPQNSRNILVADSRNKRVQEVTLTGEHVRTIGEGVIDGGAMGIAASADLIAVTSESFQVYLFDVSSGDLIRSFGWTGETNGDMRGLYGIRFTLDGAHVLVTEASGLLLFTLNGESVRCMRTLKTVGSLDVDFISNGELLVGNLDSLDVSVLSPDGSTLLRSFGGKVHGRTLSPVAFAVHCDKLLVLDANRDGSCVHVFK